MFGMTTRFSRKVVEPMKPMNPSIGPLDKSSDFIRLTLPSQTKYLGLLADCIDLICRKGQRYYLIDYKSNDLGADPGAYEPASLVRAMAGHNYGLQVWIYSLILHRYLAWTLEDYDHDHHFGGVCYLFVRGMDPARPGSGVHATRPELSTLTALERALTGAS